MGTGLCCPAHLLVALETYKSDMLFLVEIIRYGNPDLGVQLFGVFDNFEKIAPTMALYNSYRGGKYPSYYVTVFEGVNPTDDSLVNRVRYNLKEHSGM